MKRYIVISSRYFAPYKDVLIYTTDQCVIGELIMSAEVYNGIDNFITYIQNNKEPPKYEKAKLLI